MQEIGVWMTESGPIGATMSYGVEGDDSEFKLPSWASGALSGAATGAMTGMAAGPYGALIGAAAGAAIGGVSAAAAPSPPTPPKPQPPRPAVQTAAPPARPAPPPARPAVPPTGAQPGGGQSSGQNAAIANALQQFAAIIPSLIQLTASSGGRREASDAPADGEGAWGIESFEGFDGAESFDEGAAEWAATGATESAWSVP